MRREWLDGVQRIGVTAGASAPDVLVCEVISQRQAWGADSVEELAGQEENIVFSVPRELRVTQVD
ncbi:4-hydroxy-3-methylbut-2-enyl diphosphate reductase [Halopseudomonas yangmingensis]|uniref:4-hydroxy-3-methylbut-2-enyl diphosphate reductase n=1 Tax=Halopseudomonas yangmingensis TaxID=1720063 RepID=A0A1I4N800_9GAMM|nr:4-hydroxy-3-methylbut-2-enyl diphosphate reductase [Halopseudomonas yangmingensis]